MKDVRALHIRTDGRMAFEEKESQDLLRPVGFKTVTAEDYNWLFASAKELGLLNKDISSYVRALLEVFSFCGCKVLPRGFESLQEIAMGLLMLGPEDELVTPIEPPDEAALPIGTRVLFHPGRGHVSLTCESTNTNGGAKILRAVLPPFTVDISPTVALLWQQQVLDALAVAGVFVGTTFELNNSGTTCIVRENSLWRPMVALGN